MQTKLPIYTNRYIPQLDGLRGIAIIMVICFHYFPGVLIFNLGWSGVDLFFVLSGFLITGRLLPYLGDKQLLRKFYWNRFLRIVPLYFCFLVVFYACWFMLSSRETLDAEKFHDHYWWGFFIFIQNWIFIYAYPIVTTHLNHLWSLATEEQFYLLFPLFILLIRQRKRLLVTGISLVLLIILCRCIYFQFYVFNNEFEKIYWNTFFRMDSFLVGLILYLLLENKPGLFRQLKMTKYLGWAMTLVLSVLLFIYKMPDKTSPFFSTVGYTFIATAYAYLLYITLSRKSRFVETVTSNKPLIYIGKISYGMYIFHWPIFLTGFAILNKILGFFNFTVSNNTLQLINAACCIPLTYFVSHISFKYFESYFLKHKAKLTEQPVS